jgi:hypothetical protein
MANRIGEIMQISPERLRICDRKASLVTGEQARSSPKCIYIEPTSAKIGSHYLSHTANAVISTVE